MQRGRTLRRSARLPGRRVVAPGEDCSGGATCAGERACEEDVCVGVYESTCSGNAPCGDCLRCETFCLVDVDCGCEAEELCPGGRLCPASGVCPPACAECCDDCCDGSTPCPDGYQCDNGNCRVELGGACGLDIDCALDATCEDDTCRPHYGQDCDDETACVAGLACDPVLSVCRSAPGLACSATRECVDGHTCEDLECRAELFEPCSTAVDCAEGLFCDTPGGPQCRLDTGEDCAEHAQCRTGHLCIDGCLPGPGELCTAEFGCADGSGCADGGTCPETPCTDCCYTCCDDPSPACTGPTVCEDGDCQALAGADCLFDLECAGSLVCDAGVCRAPYGHECSEAIACATGLVCDPDLAVCRQDAGETCGSARDCAAGHVCDVGNVCRPVSGSDCTVVSCATGHVCRSDDLCAIEPGGDCSAEGSLCTDLYVCDLDDVCRPVEGGDCSEIACATDHECRPDDTCLALECGNGVVQAGEVCDDDDQSGDGCSADCELEGCANGLRVAFNAYETYPDVAVCGTQVTYVTARDNAGTVCESGWHQCVPYDGQLNAELTGVPQPAEGVNAWLNYDDPACNIQEQYGVAGCGGSVTQFSHFNGTGGCHPSGTCGEGYRPILTTGSAWTWSLRGGGVGGPCTNHITYLCAFSGGTSPQATAYTACCRD